ncbi:Lacal_2735 family protein [Tamlana fucoidanivorans]|uniref:Lacal_2735 family protein n=1 Tax=Allotamlana fucoidanivorans TaxID=2583814 RepID=A0A5C4SHM6_9FLAO|nr:Lacal_2735 family protein [Tamlana fucoidanivorans]TNJ42852.1 Lacal_2735 family protein [Tamlana fucoidanivorans]
MNTQIRNHQNKLKAKYKQLIELAYNFRQIDAPLSDIFEYKSIKILNEINRLQFLYVNAPKK